MTDQTNDSPARFQILALDGGGIKGIFIAAMLAAIEDDLNIDVTDHFDLIAGTSTGGIIALALGLGLRPKEIVEFYLTEGPKIFGSCYGLKAIQHWFICKFSAEPLEDALKRRFQEKLFGESKKRLVIPAYNLGEDDVYIFRTPHHERLANDFKVPAWSVARATSAAPTFFPCTRKINNVRLIDGGVWANNPAMVAIVEAFGTLDVPLENQYVFSIGTSEKVNHRRKRLDWGGIFAWGIGNVAVDVVMRGQSIGTNNQARFLLGNDHVHRMDPKVSADEFSLDGIKKAEDLIGKAAHYSRKFMPTFKKTFAHHIAPEYIPEHRVEVKDVNQ